MDPSEFAVRLGADGDIMPLNDINDYRTEYSPKKLLLHLAMPEINPLAVFNSKLAADFTMLKMVAHKSLSP